MGNWGVGGQEGETVQSFYKINEKKCYLNKILKRESKTTTTKM